MYTTNRKINIVIMAIAVSLAILFFSSLALADKESVTNYTTNNYTEVVELTELKPVFQSNHCQGVAIGQATANTQVYMGASKPQLSLGLGACEGEVAGAIKLGMKLSKNTMINGSFAKDESVDAVGVGFTIILQ
jgi:hypothetical protein